MTAHLPQPDVHVLTRPAVPTFWQLQLLGWAGFYVAMAFSRMGRFPLSYMLVEKFVLTALGICASLVLRAVLRPLLARRPMPAIIVTCVLASYGIAMVWTAVFNILEYPIALAFLDRARPIRSIGQLLNGTVYHSFSLVAWGFLYVALKHYIELLEERERALRAETMVVDVKLRALQSQLNPHLFFNMLNTLSTLVVDRRNDEAAAMIARLADFLRETLRHDRASQVALAEELAFTGLYLDIEQVRFGDRLRVTYDVDEEAYRALVPVLLLQPLVENATRHGIAKLVQGGTIAIGARVEGLCLIISIENDAPVDTVAAETRAGLGLANVRERLAVLYGVGQEVTTSALPDGRFRVCISMPLVTTPLVPS